MRITLLFSLLWFFILPGMGQKSSPAAFKVVPLGVRGGMDESNLSAYMVAAAGTNDYICFDAGTIHAGIKKAIANNTFAENAPAVLKNYIKGYLISHAHLDHVSGLIINSPEDSVKVIYALLSCMEMLEKYYFNGEAWANFGDEGKGLLLKKYHFNTLVPGSEIPVANTSMQVEAFSLSHVNPYESAAFLLRNGNNYVLYLGDTGADKLEPGNKLYKLWEKIAPLVVSKHLKGIFLEASFPNEQPNNRLFGHLTPGLLMEEMGVLATMTGSEAIKGLALVVTHMKPIGDNEKQIREQLIKGNKHRLRLIFPVQGKGFNL